MEMALKIFKILLLYILPIFTPMFLLALFIAQNMERTSDLSLDLYWVAMHLSKPVPVAPLLLGTLLVGLLAGALYGYLKGRGSQAGHGPTPRSSESGDAWT